MSLIDTTDNVLMLGAYGWAFIKPIRKLYYNMTTTSVSVVVALVVGGIEALGLTRSALFRRSTSRPSINGVADRTNLEIRRHCTHQKLIIVMKPVSQTAVSISGRIRTGAWEAVGCATGMAIGGLRAVTSRNGWLISSIAT
jgi:hypothetical protein